MSPKNVGCRVWKCVISYSFLDNRYDANIADADVEEDVLGGTNSKIKAVVGLG